MNGFAIVKSKSEANPTPLADHTDTIALTLTFLDDFGPTLIWGRIGLGNLDADPQSAAAWLVWQRDFTNEPAEQLDRLTLWLAGLDDGGAAGCVSLQGWVNARKGQIIELHCATYRGSWNEASLMALGIVEWRVSP